MEIAKNLFVLFHFLGLASLLGGALVQVGNPAPKLTRFIRDGAYTQLLTGLILVVFAEMGTRPVNHIKIGIKLLVVLGVIAVILINRKKDGVTPGTLNSVLGLAVLNTAVATLWH